LKILIAEDERITRRNLERQLAKLGHEVIAAEDGLEAFDLLQAHDVSLLITDWEMPRMNGLDLLRKVRELDKGQYTYVILLTSKSEKQYVIEGMDAGADDFLSKPFDRNELNARLRAGIRVVELQRHLAQRNNELSNAHRAMKKDLAAAVDYVMSLIPDSNLDPATFSWRYIPSADLGGDTFGFHRVTDDRVALYLVDVTGHGLDSALLSVSIINMLRSGALPATDFRDPGAVLHALNERFQGSEQGGKLFTIWYGVIDIPSSTLKWAGGGHPDALLFDKNSSSPTLLPSTGLIMGVLRDQEYETLTRPLLPGSRIFMYSDGVYEVTQSNGKIWSQRELVDYIGTLDLESPNVMDSILDHVRGLRGSNVLEDDFTIVQAHYADAPK